MIALSDCHAHPAAFPAGVILPAGVAWVHLNATREDDWPAALAFASTPRFRVSLGLHPWHAATAAPGWLGRLRTALRDARDRGLAVVGVGEAGLDGSLPPETFPAQWDAFRAQWDLSADLALPLSLHGRGAWPRLLEFLLDAPPHPGGVLLHAYAGPSDVLSALAARGVRVSVGPALLRPGHKRQRAAAKEAPLASLLLETDADRPPYPALLPDLLRAVAELRGQTPQNLAAALAANAGALFAPKNPGIPGVLP